MGSIFDLMKMRAAATIENVVAAMPDFGEAEDSQEQEEKSENEA